MDPNANLEEQRAILYEHVNDGSPDLERLAELALAMDEWLCGGGFLPVEWEANRTRDEWQASHKHDFQAARFTEAVTCAKCHLLPLDDEDINSPCPGRDDENHKNTRR